VVAAESNGGEDIFFIVRNYDAYRDLAVIGTIGGIERAAARVEADFSTKVAAERGLERRSV
jgi:hypothetical protein